MRGRVAGVLEAELTTWVEGGPAWWWSCGVARKVAEVEESRRELLERNLSGERAMERVETRSNPNDILSA